MHNKNKGPQAFTFISALPFFSRACGSVVLTTRGFFLTISVLIWVSIFLSIFVATSMTQSLAAPPSTSPSTSPTTSEPASGLPDMFADDTEAEAVDELIVSATGIATPHAQIGSAVSYLTMADIERLQTPNMLDLLSHLPGLSVDREGVDGGLGYVRIRGLDRQYATVLLDGITMGDPADPYGSAELSNFLSSGIGRIEVLRGSHSILYGSNAIAGAINILTPRLSGPLQTQLRLEAGSQNTRRAEVLVGGGETIRGFVLANHQESQPSSDFSKTTPGFIEREDYENQSIMSRFEIDIDDQQSVSILARASRTSAERDGYDANFQAVDGWFGENTHEWMSHLAYQYALSPSDQLTASVSYFSRDRDSFEDPSFGGEGYWNDGSRLKGKIAAQFALGDHGNIHLGIEHSEEHFSQKNLIRKESEMRAGFVMVHYQLTPELATTIGGRRDHHDRFKDHDSYRWAAAYTPIPRVILRASYGTGFRAPSLYELYGENSYCPNNLCGNVNLTPETSQSYDAGIAFDGDVFSADLTLFRIRTEDKIIFSPSGRRYENDRGQSTSEGVEAVASWQLMPRLTTQVTATYVDPRSSDGGLANKQPRQILLLDVNYKLANDRGQFGVFMREVSHRYIYNVRQEDYTLLGLRGEWAWRPDRIFTARVENALNEEYVVSYGFPPRSTPRRQVTLGMTARF